MLGESSIVMVLLINCPSLWSPEKPLVCPSSFLKKCFNHLCLYKESFFPKSKNWGLNSLALNFNTWLNTPLQCQSEVFIPKYKTTKYSVCISWLASRLTGLTRSGCLHSKSIKRLGIAVTMIFSILTCSMAVWESQEHGFSIQLFCEGISSYVIIRADTILMNTLSQTFWNPSCFILVFWKKKKGMPSTPY